MRAVVLLELHFRFTTDACVRLLEMNLDVTDCVMCFSMGDMAQTKDQPLQSGVCSVM